MPEVAEAALTPPPGYELHETLICMLERRKGPNNLDLPPKTFSIPIRMFIPRDRCAELSADSQLRAVPGDCPIYPPKVTSCN